MSKVLQLGGAIYAGACWGVQGMQKANFLP
jgi:hypothetical protein